MQDRRTFLKEVAVGAAVLGAGSSKLLHATEGKSASKSRVVVARDAALRTPGPAPDPKRVAALLDRAMQSWYHTADAVSPWKEIVKPGQVVGLKVNTIAGKGLSTHVALVAAIVERLKQAGVKPENIIIWDRTSRELEAAGFKTGTDSSGARCYGTDTVGYEDAEESFGAVRTQLSKILTRQCDLVINLPVLKDHIMAGVTLAMKNMYGVIRNPNAQHGGGCNPYVADLNMIRVIREKVRFIVGDAMTGQYQGGPGFKPEYTWNENALIVGEDRVAVDHTAWQIIERKRAEKGLNTLEAAGRPPRYIATAADAQHRLGTNDPRRITMVEV
jgi:uncharacterized protein (DUF362 family)